MRFNYENYLEDYTLSAADEYSGVYEVENLIDRRLAKVYRSAEISNFMTYGDCEETTSPTLDGGTTGLSNATWARSGVEYNEGSYSWVFTKTSAAAGGDAENWLTDNVDTDDLHGLIAGRTYRLKADIFTDVASLSNAKIIIQEYYSAAWHDVLTLVATSASTWQSKKGSFTLNTATTAVTIKLEIDTAEAAGKLMYLDDIRVYLEKRIFLDCGSGVTINPTVFELLNHNISSNGEVRVQGNNTNSWTSPTFDEAITYDSEHMIEYITASALRYWSILIDDPDNTDEYIEIGYIRLSTYLQATKGPARVFMENLDDKSIDLEGVSGQVLGYIQEMLKMFDLNVPWWTIAMKNNFETMYAEISRVRPITLVIDENNMTNLPPVYGRILEFQFTHIKGTEYWSMKFRFKESS